MPNDSLISSESMPVFTHANILNFSERVSELGKLYTITTGSISTAANGYLGVQLTNPADSGKTFYIAKIAGGSAVDSTVAVYKNATITGTPTSVTPHNMNWSFSDSSVATAAYLSAAADPTTGGTRMTSITQAGGQLIFDCPGEFIIPSTTSARQFYIRVANNTNQVNLMSVCIIWWELDDGVSP